MYKRQLNDILNDIGPNHVLVLINAHAPVSWVPGTNDALSDFAATHSNNVVLVDWDATISAYPDELAGDGIPVSYTHLDVYKRQTRIRVSPPSC